MEYLILLKANIKRQKGSFIGIMVIIFLVTVCVCSTITLCVNSKKYVESEIDRIGFGDYTSWIYATDYLDEIARDLERNENVDRVEIRNAIDVNEYFINGEISSDPKVFLMPYEGINLKYKRLNPEMTGVYEGDSKLKKGEILISPAFCELYDCRIGDEMVIELGEPGAITFKIAGYIEDPIMGGAMMGMKVVLISNDDYEEICEWLDGDYGIDYDNISNVGMIHTYKNTESKLSENDFQNVINNETILGEYTEYAYSRNAMVGFMLLLQNLFSGFLLAFVLILLTVALIIIGHNVSTTIEQDYVNMGILKAVGFTKHHLRILQIAQYMLSIFIGMIAGISVLGFGVSIMNQSMITVTSILIPTEIPFLECLSVLITILILFIAFIFIKTIKIKNNTPIKAIRNGKDEIYFSSRAKMPIYKKGMNFFLALRQFVSGIRGYIGVTFIVTLLVFVVMLATRMNVWISDKEGLLDLFSNIRYDLGIKYYNDEDREEALEIINRHTEIEAEYDYAGYHIMLNGINYNCSISGAPEYFYILEGRTCAYNNEVLITEFMSEELGISIGDTVTVSFGENSAEYIVSGLYQNINDMGYNFAVSYEGIKRIADNIKTYKVYILEDSEKTDIITGELLEKFGENIDVNLSGRNWQGYDVLVMSVESLVVLIYIVVVIFVLVVVALTGSKILFKEKYDLSIYKVLGFNIRKLRMTFALRFGIASVIGSVIGIVLSALCTDAIVLIIMKMCGISRFSTSLGVIDTIVPSVVVTVLFMLFAYISSRKIKKVGMELLNME